MAKRISEIKEQIEKQKNLKAPDDKFILFTPSKKGVSKNLFTIAIANLKEPEELIVEDLETPRIEDKEKPKK